MGTHKQHTQQTTTNKDNSSNMATQSNVPLTVRDFFFDDPFFKSSWENFDKVREAMFNENREMWKRFDKDFREMAAIGPLMLESEEKTSKGRDNDVIALDEIKAGRIFPVVGCFPPFLP